MTNSLHSHLVALVASVAVFTLLTLLLSTLVLLIRKIAIKAESCTVLVNNTSTLEGVWGETLLKTLNDQGIPVPSSCAGAGTCGLCRVELGGDLPRPTPAEKSQLSRRDIDAGARLACQTKLHGNLSVTVPDDILIADEWTCEVASARSLSPLIKELILSMPGEKTLEFKPGSYVQITAPAYELPLANLSVAAEFQDQWHRLEVEKMTAGSLEPVSRAYSLANTPDQTTSLVLLIRLALPPLAMTNTAPPGIVSSWLFSLKPGDHVQVAGPFGDFHLRPSEREMVLVGGGVGMAPLWALLHQELQSERKRKVRFFYGARSQWDVFLCQGAIRAGEDTRAF